MFVRYNSEPNIQPFKKKASTAFSKGAVCELDSNGYLAPATASSTINGIVGIIMQDIASTDPDYAQNSMVNVDVFRRLEDQFIADTVTTVLAQTDVGETVELVDSLTINVGLSAYPLVRVERVYASSKALVTFMTAIS